MKNVGFPNEPCRVAWTREPIDRALCDLLFAPHGQPNIMGVEVDRSDDPCLAFSMFAADKFPPNPYAKIEIGENCFIHPSAVLGCPGFGHSPLKLYGWVDFPHYGGVVIGDDTRINALATVARGAIGNTIIGNGCRIDSHVHIAHNDVIGNRVSIAAGSILGGSVTVGDDVRVETNVTIFHSLTIGQGARIGSGAVVTKDVPAGEVWVGNPAKQHVKRTVAPRVPSYSGWPF